MFRMFSGYYAEGLLGKSANAFDVIGQQKPCIYGNDHNYC